MITYNGQGHIQGKNQKHDDCHGKVTITRTQENVTQIEQRVQLDMQPATFMNAQGKQYADLTCNGM